MSTDTSVQDTWTARTPVRPVRYTVEQLARSVGMSPRNIRAHQTRKLIDPPVREGRTAYYNGDHLRRLETIQSLQEQGFNLAAIEAILSGGGAAPCDGLIGMLQRIDSEDPSLVHALSRHGIVGRGEDGTVHPVQSRILQSALDLDRAGLSPVLSLQVLAELLDSLRPLADELRQTTNARIQALLRRGELPNARTWDEVNRNEIDRNEIDRNDAGMVRGLVNLLTEAFRVTADNPHAGGQIYSRR